MDYDSYMDELAELMDCAPRPLRLLLSEPRLALRLLFGPNLPYSYRLRGWDAWPGARQAVLGCEERVLAGLRQRQVPLSSNLFGVYLTAFCVLLVGLVAKFLL